MSYNGIFVNSIFAMSKNSKILLLISFFVFLVFLRNFAFWSDSQTFILGDTAVDSLFIVSLSQHLDKFFSLKETPLAWNPSFMAVGIPSLSNIDIGFLYPPHLLIAFLAKLWGNPLLVFPFYIISLFLHLIMGSFFVYKILEGFWRLDYLSSLLGALLWIFIGFNLEYLAASSVTLSASYFPACFYFVISFTQSKKRKDFFWLFGLLSLSFFVGYPMISLVILGVCFITSIFFERNLDFKIFLKTIKIYILGVGLIVLPLNASLYFSSFLNLPYSTRAPLSWDSFFHNSAEVSDLVESILPQNTPFNRRNVINQDLASFSFVGLLIFFQVKDKLKFLKDRKNLILLSIGFLSLIISLGKLTVLPTLAFFLLPAASFFKRLSVLPMVSGFVFCFFVAQSFWPALKNKKTTGILKLIGGGLLILFLISQLMTILFVNQENLNLSGLQQSLGLVLILAITTWLAFKIYSFWPKLAVSWLFFALLLEAGTLVATKVSLNSPISARQILGPNRLITRLQELVGPGERVDIHGSQNSYCTDLFDLEQTTGYASVGSQYGVFLSEALNQGGSQADNLRDILGIKYLVRKAPIDNPGLKRIAPVFQPEGIPEFFAYNYELGQWEAEPAETEYFFYENPNALERVYLASDIKEGDQTKEILAEIGDLKNPRVVFIDKDDLEKKFLAEGEVELLDYKRNYLKVRTKTESVSFLANSTGYYPGWRVKINNQRANLIRTNWFMMGVYLPEGENLVEFYYLPYGILAGIIYLGSAGIFWSVKGKKLLENFLS